MLMQDNLQIQTTSLYKMKKAKIFFAFFILYKLELQERRISLSNLYIVIYYMYNTVVNK